MFVGVVWSASSQTTVLTCGESNLADRRGFYTESQSAPNWWGRLELSRIAEYDLWSGYGGVPLAKGTETEQKKEKD